MARVRPLDRARDLVFTLYSLSVPHSLQDGHCPCHLANSSPQEEQRNTILTLDFAMIGWEIDPDRMDCQELRGFTSLCRWKNNTAVWNNRQD